MASIPWADSPWPLIETPSKSLNIHEHSSIYIANEMVFAHNAMIRGINSIYNQAPHVHAPKDITDFLFFVKSWAEWVTDHHHLEETQMFTGFEEVMGKPGFLEVNVEQHHAFEPGLKELLAFANDTRPEDYKPEMIQSIINSFATPLQGHLHGEITTLLSMRPYDGEGLLQVYRKCEATAGEQDKTVVPPMVMGLCDRTYQGGNNWPATPEKALKVIADQLSIKHAGSWRFLHCDTFGKPRPLSFV